MNFGLFAGPPVLFSETPRWTGVVLLVAFGLAIGYLVRASRGHRFVLEGLSNKEIAWRLQISESYVKAILQSLFQKTGVRTRGQLVRVAFEQYEDQL